MHDGVGGPARAVVVRGEAVQFGLTVGPVGHGPKLEGVVDVELADGLQVVLIERFVWHSPIPRRDDDGGPAKVSGELEGAVDGDQRAACALVDAVPDAHRGHRLFDLLHARLPVHQLDPLSGGVVGGDVHDGGRDAVVLVEVFKLMAVESRRACEAHPRQRIALGVSETRQEVGPAVQPDHRFELVDAVLKVIVVHGLPLPFVP